MRAALALFALLSVPLLAQTPAVSKSFVIADVHVSPFSANPFMHGNSIQGDRYFLTQATMLDLVATAYGVDAANVQGGPTWLERDRYDIRAKGTGRRLHRTTSSSCFATLLAERFHLVVRERHRASMPAYVLSAEPREAEDDRVGR